MGFELFGRHLVESASKMSSGIADHDVDPAEMIDHTGDQILDLLRMTDIRTHPEHLGASLLEPLDSVLDLLPLPAADGEPHAFLGKAAGCRKPDAARSAGD